jgi:hypothetical protein
VGLEIGGDLKLAGVAEGVQCGDAFLSVELAAEGAGCHQEPEAEGFHRSGSIRVVICLAFMP